MTREQLGARLREHEAVLHHGGILHLRLCGSMARGDASAASDIDLMADFDGSRKLTLFNKAGLELCELLNIHVDLSDRAMLRDIVRERAEQEAVLVFRDPRQSLRLLPVRMETRFLLKPSSLSASSNRPASTKCLTQASIRFTVARIPETPGGSPAAG
jgi:hypothetical protein